MNGSFDVVGKGVNGLIEFGDVTPEGAYRLVRRMTMSTLYNVSTHPFDSELCSLRNSNRTPIDNG